MPQIANVVEPHLDSANGSIFWAVFLHSFLKHVRGPLVLLRSGALESEAGDNFILCRGKKAEFASLKKM